MLEHGEQFGRALRLRAAVEGEGDRGLLEREGLHRLGAGLDDLLAVRDDERDLLHGGLLGGLVGRHADAAANGAVDHEDRREDQEGDH